MLADVSFFFDARVQSLCRSFLFVMKPPIAESEPSASIQKKDARKLRSNTVSNSRSSGAVNPIHFLFHLVEVDIYDNSLAITNPSRSPLQGSIGEILGEQARRRMLRYGSPSALVQTVLASCASSLLHARLRSPSRLLTPTFASSRFEYAPRRKTSTGASR